MCMSVIVKIKLQLTNFKILLALVVYTQKLKRQFLCGYFIYCHIVFQIIINKNKKWEIFTIGKLLFYCVLFPIWIFFKVLYTMQSK